MFNKSNQLGIVARYLVSGSAAALVHFGFLIFLVEMFLFNPTLASALGFIAAVFVNYSLQYHWTFEIQGNGLHKVYFTRYLLVTLMTLILNTSIFWSLNEVAGLQYIFSQILATGIVLVVNFMINQNYTFKQCES